MKKLKVLTIFGTRPEAIKMAPVIAELGRSSMLTSRVCVTAQHREMLDQALAIFDIVPDFDLDIMQPGQSLDEMTSRVLSSVGKVLDIERPDLVLVHGDTTTTMATTLAAFYRKLRVGHVEAGLRSGSLLAPWPEELNRRIVTLGSYYHFAPTEIAKENLLSEGVDVKSIHVTGNTVIDALLATVERTRKNGPKFWDNAFQLVPHKPLILVTGHRRENFGDGFQGVCDALIEIADTYSVQIVFPVHPNPNVSGTIHARLAGHSAISLIPPLEYEAFVALMDRARLIITDSGGIQEEAPSLGKPVLVMRDTTERPEAVEAGVARLVGTDSRKILAETARLLTDSRHYRSMSTAINPYGDGLAARRICQVIEGM